jgi:dienelactone hydrolase
MKRALVTKLVLLALCASALLPAAAARAQALAGYGIVLMHGKGGMPGGALSRLAAALEAQGAQVTMPEMPWSRTRRYDATRAEALAQIDGAVAQLRSSGARKIAVGGHSFGANAALAYGARPAGIVGIVALAPGHRPEAPGVRAVTGPGLAKARDMLASGQGDVPSAFPDTNQGEDFTVTATPRIYLNLFDPAGPASLTRNAAGVRAPLLWVVGTGDPLYPRTRALFAAGSRDPKSKLAEVPAGHVDTPRAAVREVIAWLKSL